MHSARQQCSDSGTATPAGSACSVTVSRRPLVLRQAIGAPACTAHLLPDALLSRERSGSLS